jgi:hypothetical protein
MHREAAAPPSQLFPPSPTQTRLPLLPLSTQEHAANPPHPELPTHQLHARISRKTKKKQKKNIGTRHDLN